MSARRPTCHPVLSRTAEYALRALLVLARHADADRLARIEDIAIATGAPRNYLSKTLHRLTRAGLVASTRGPLGGFALARPADAITVADVSAPFAEPRPAAHCLLGTGPCNAARPCAAHRRWSAIAAAANEPLARTTLADLLGGDALAPPASA